MIVIKSTLTERNNAFNAFISRLHLDKERMSKFKDRSVGTVQIKIQVEKI